MRRRLMLLITVALSAAGIVTLAPAEAEAFCGPEDGCDPCPFEVIVDGKNTRIQWYYC